MLKRHLNVYFSIYSILKPNRCVFTFQLKKSEVNKHLRSFTNYPTLLNSVKLKRSNSSINLSDFLSKELSVSSVECSEILNRNKINVTVDHAKKILDICNKYKVSNENLLKYINILNFNEDALLEKLKEINAFKLKDINDGLSLVNMPISYFRKKSSYKVNFRKRLYYIAEKFDRPPDEVAKSISKRSFVCTMDFDHFKSALDLLIEYGVSPENIMRDWWALRHNLSTIEQKLQKFKLSGREKLMPWMVKCVGHVYLRALYISENHLKKLEGGKKSPKDLLQELLECSPETVDMMCVTFPKLERVRIFKMLEIHVYLMKEGFTNQDIIKAPKIFAHSLSTIQLRLEQLRSVQGPKVNLKTICNSKKAFEQYIRPLKQNH